MIALPLIESCDDCGRCCLHLDTPPFHERERNSLPAELLAQIEAVEAGQTSPDENGGPCLWFDPATKRCRHYDIRPDACRYFPLGGEDCRRLRQEGDAEERRRGR